MDMEITWPSAKYLEGRYKEYIVRMGPSEKPWWEGPTPGAFDLFMMSIGLCTAAVVWGFMDHRDLSIKDMRIEMKREFSEEEHRITLLETILHMPPDFPEKYKDAVGRAADTCAVKRHMKQPPEMTTKVVIGN